MQNKVFETFDLDINKMDYDKDGIKDYSFPIDHSHVHKHREIILKKIIIFLENDDENTKDYKECIKLNFKWFIKDILNFLYSVYFVQEFKKKKKKIIIPKRDIFLRNISENLVPQTPFEKLWNGPRKQNYIF